MKCKWCGRAIWLNEPSGEWFHESTAERACTDFVGSRLATPMTEIKRVMINGRWPLNLPAHRADRPEWPYWEATRLAAMHHHIQPGDVIYDIGAEAGDFSALFATWGAKPVLIEPNPKAWPTIKAVWEANQLQIPIWFQGLLSDHTARRGDDVGLGIYDWPAPAMYPMDPDHGFLHIADAPDVSMATVDVLAKLVHTPPDIITMDVEGGEWHVLQGATETLETHKSAVFMSVHPQFMLDLYSQDVSLIHQRMKKLGYHGRFLCEDHEQHFVWTHPERRMFPGVAKDYYIPGDRIVL